MSDPKKTKGGAEGSRLSSTGSAAAIIAAVVGACCISPALLPFIFGFLGASGTAQIAGLRPYGGWILITTGIAFAVGFWVFYRPQASRECHHDAGDQRLLPVIARGALWGCALSWIIALVLFLRT